MTSTEALNNFFLSVIIIFTVYFILDLIGNAMLLKSTGQKMWIGFIPVVNDFSYSAHFGTQRCLLFTSHLLQ